MKYLIISLLGMFCLHVSGQVQDCRDRQKYEQQIRMGDSCLAIQHFLKARDHYNAARVFCHDNRDIAERRKDSVFGLVNKAVESELIARAAAERSAAIALREQRRADSAARAAEENLLRVNKLVNAFYFYEGRFALAFGPSLHPYRYNRYYFIDKNGDRLTALGEYEKAGQFDQTTGFALVMRPDSLNIQQEHLLDTLGNAYQVAYHAGKRMRGITAFDLSAEPLRSFPGALLTNPQTKVLILNLQYQYRQRVRVLPAEIGTMQQLRTLYISFCSLESVPPEIGKLSQLTHLRLNNNSLKTLPATFTRLESLETLDLAGNYLTALPDGFGELRHLRSLNLLGNALTTLPEDIGNLNQLTSLVLSSNKLSVLPASICQLTHLQDLQLSLNALTTLPEEIGQLKALKYLRLSGNPLKELPACLASLPHLELLAIRRCSLSVVPPVVTQLPALKELGLSENALSSLPAEMGRLTTLERLNLEYNALTTLPEALTTLSRLTLLDVSRNQLTRLPEGIGQLQALESLHLQFNRGLTTLPESFYQLTNLRELWVEGCGLTEETLAEVRRRLPACAINQ